LKIARDFENSAPLFPALLWRKNHSSIASRNFESIIFAAS
jgi:hypothetical protein